MIPTRPSVRDVLTPSLRREPTPEQQTAEEDAVLRSAVVILRHQGWMVARYGDEEQRDAIELFGMASALDNTRRKHWVAPSEERP